MAQHTPYAATNKMTLEALHTVVILGQLVKLLMHPAISGVSKTFPRTINRFLSYVQALVVQVSPAAEHNLSTTLASYKKLAMLQKALSIWIAPHLNATNPLSKGALCLRREGRHGLRLIVSDCEKLLHSLTPDELPAIPQTPKAVAVLKAFRSICKNANWDLALHAIGVSDGYRPAAARDLMFMYSSTQGRAQLETALALIAPNVAAPLLAPAERDTSPTTVPSSSLYVAELRFSREGIQALPDVKAAHACIMAVTKNSALLTAYNSAVTTLTQPKSVPPGTTAEAVAAEAYKAFIQDMMTLTQLAKESCAKEAEGKVVAALRTLGQPTIDALLANPNLLQLAKLE